jgi:hypothetical protein
MIRVGHVDHQLTFLIHHISCLLRQISEFRSVNEVIAFHHHQGSMHEEIQDSTRGLIVSLQMDLQEIKALLWQVEIFSHQL